MHSCMLCPMQHDFKMHCELLVTFLKHANEGDKELVWVWVPVAVCDAFKYVQSYFKTQIQTSSHAN